MSRHRNDSFLDLLLKLPWWVSLVLGVLGYVGVKWLLPGWSQSKPSLINDLAQETANYAPVVFIFFGLIGIISFFFQRKRRLIVNQQTSIDDQNQLSWKEFEYLVAEAYRLKGFHVDYSLGRGADGGIDMVLKRNGRTTLVQCKQWKVMAVGVSVVREMFGLMIAEKADEVIIVTSGSYTDDAIGFAYGKPIRLIDGPQLLALVRSVQTETQESTTTIGTETSQSPACPRCGKPMVSRKAQRGPHANNSFWSCSAFPDCRGTRRQVNEVLSESRTA